ncbi:hypothetical protein VTN77DRAFT_4762 [Rasamsonia byssochlamydoides]|uniref:uncharacterized protein n=1 Tax=Rasamsonia byssochlamydoides TaxID=89139 RepID=UPI003742D278
MVTVPLSDRQSGPNFCHDSRMLDIPETPIEETVDGEGSMSPQEEKVQTTPKNEDASRPASEIKERRGSEASARSQSSRESRDPESPAEGDGVDWAKLDETEEQEPRNEATDESTALLLARLEQENNALVTNPKSGLASAARPRRPSRPPSIQQLKRLINDPRSSLRYSQLPTPPMTELEFWAALVADYPMTAQRLPTLTAKKIRAGVPPPLRGVVWPSIAGARDTQLLEDFRRLSGESSPYEGLIGKDIGRSFPNVEMFRDPNGEGQQMLARVLKCFSLYDTKIGYCQGLGFVVGPLLMHMSDAEAFCVLVRLMDHYNLRSCFLPDLSGLHLRIYQFQTLLSRHLPSLFAHLESLHVEPVYVSQWFLSFFAVTCPLPMLLRIYDVLLLEGASETLMRVALSLMQRNEKKIMACTEFEDVMQLLLSRSLWDTYGWNADDLVNDFVSLTPLVTKESLQALEASYNQSQGVSTGISFPQMQAAASRFLGRLWAGSNSHNSTKSINLNPANAGGVRPDSTVRRSPSKQSMASTLNSLESTSSDASTAPTEVSTTSGGDSVKVRAKSAMSHKDKDLHVQIEELLTALSDLQREHADLARELQREREEREEDHDVAKAMLAYIKDLDLDNKEGSEEIITKAEERFLTTPRRLSIVQTKHQLRDEAARWKEKHDLEAARCVDLARRIDDYEMENARLKEDLREARSRIQDSHRERQRLERIIQELRSRKYSDSAHDGSSSGESSDVWPSPGLREIKLVSRASSQNSQKTNNNKFPKRSSSLGLQGVLAAENNAPAGSHTDDSLLLELVNAKTAEAVAKQELEEVKAKLESLKRMISNSQGNMTPRPSPSIEPSIPVISSVRSSPEQSKASTPGTSAAGGGGGGGGGFFSGWAKRTVSTASFEAKS